MALREVMKYDDVKLVVMLEPDAALVSVCENHLGGSRYEHDVRVHLKTGDPVKGVQRLLGQAENLQSFDLIIVDTKERATPAGLGTADFFMDLRTLLADGGVLVKSGDVSGVLSAAFPHTLVYSFHSVIHDTQHRMVLASGVDLVAKRIDAPRMKATHHVHARFYNPLKHFAYVPWFAGAKTLNPAGQ